MMLENAIKEYESNKEARKFIGNFVKDLFERYRREKKIFTISHQETLIDERKLFLKKMDILIQLLEDELPEDQFKVFQNFYLMSPKKKKTLFQLAMENNYQDETYFSKLRSRARLKCVELVILLELETDYLKAG